MQINTKYNIGDKVWWIENNKVHQGNVRSIHFSMYDSDYGSVLVYLLAGDVRDFKEDVLFPTKEELLKSL